MGSNSLRNLSEQLQIPSPLIQLPKEAFPGYDVWVKRDDLIHKDIPGNKWRKLRLNIDFAFAHQKTGIITFGGAFSNHITATAAACYYAGLESIGILRGEEVSNPALKTARDFGMQLRFISRELYKQKSEPDFLEKILGIETDKYHVVPEGGANALGAEGCRDIVDEIDVPFDFIINACGTGTTTAGILKAIQPHQTAIGISVLKNGGFLKDEIAQWTDTSALDLQTDFHFGGYAKTTTELLGFIRNFQNEYNIPLDYVYTGKMMFALQQLIAKDYFPKGSRIIAVHTGGVANATVI